MQTFLAIIGALVLFCAICGAIIPDLNFHVVFGDDKGTLHWHQQQADVMEKRIADKGKP